MSSSTRRNRRARAGQSDPAELFPGYRVITGNAQAISFDPFRLNRLATSYHAAELYAPGIKLWGSYRLSDTNRDDVVVPVVSFLYKKYIDPDAEKLEFEQDDRLLLLTGKGFGVHPDHTGQDPSEYLIGVKLGAIDKSTKREKLVSYLGQLILPNHFSVDCIVGATDQEAIIANPPKALHIT